MRRTSPLLALLGLAVVLFPALSADDKDAPSPENLIEQLADKDFQVRQAAAQALEKLGQAALPALRKAIKHADPDVRKVVAKRIAELEELELVAATLITMDMPDKPLKDIVAELTKQTGYKFDIGGQPDDKRTFSLNCTKIPFWQALDELCAQDGIVPQPDWQDANLFRLYFQNRDQDHIWRHEGIRMVAHSFHVSRSNRIDARPRDPKQLAPDLRGHELMQFSFTVMSEPRLRMVNLGQPQASTAVDDLGDSLVLLKQPQANGRIGRFRPSGQQTASLQLQCPSSKATQVKAIKGVLPVFVVKDTKTVTLTDKVQESTGKQFEVGNHNLDIEEFRKCDDGTFRLKISATTNGTEEDFEVEFLDLVCGKDAKFAKGKTSMSRVNRRTSAEVFFTPPDGNQVGQPAKLTYTILNTTELAIPFEFKNLPLP